MALFETESKRNVFSDEFCTDLQKLTEYIHDYSSSVNANEIVADMDEIELINYLNIFLDSMQSNSEKQFRYIQSQFGECSIENCIILKRNYRIRNAHNDKEYEKTYQRNEKVYHLHIIDKIHCFYQHFYTISRFTQEHHNNTSINQFNQYQLINETYKIPKSKVANVHSTKFNQLTAHSKQDTLINEFYSFGSKLVFGEKDRYTFDCKKYILVEPIYLNLQKELIQNKFSRITLKQYQNELGKAELHLHTAHCREMYSSITVEHLLSLMIYCNYDSLQNKFSLVCRQNNNDVQYFYHLGKYLKEVVHDFGTTIKDGPWKKFYHGIGKKLIFPEIIGTNQRGICTYCPLSTSISFEVAVNFTNSNLGLVVEFGGSNDGDAKYFSTNWLSDYPHEQEQFFFQSYHPLIINNIIDVSTGAVFDPILHALRLVDDIRSGKRCTKKISSKLLQLTATLLEHQLSTQNDYEYRSFQSLHEYGQLMITQYFNNQQELNLDFRDINCNEYKFLINLLFFPNFEWIKIDVVCMLFPNIEDITVRHIDLLSVTFNNILHHLDIQKHSARCINSIQILAIQHSHLSVQDALSQFKQLFEDVGFQLEKGEKIGWLSIFKSATLQQTQIFHNTDIDSFVAQKPATPVGRQCRWLLLMVLILLCGYVFEFVAKNQCDINASCKHDLCSLFGCECNHGWKDNGQTCVEICDTSPCGHDAFCISEMQTERGFSCVCNHGWEGDGFHCEAFNTSTTIIQDSVTDNSTSYIQQWRLLSDAFPYADYGMVVGYDPSFDANIIVILGGFNHRTMVYLYDIRSSKIYVYPKQISQGVYSNRQNYVTLYHKIYYSTGYKLYIYHMHNSTFSAILNDPIVKSSGECLASNSDQLYVIGGHTYEDKKQHTYFQIYLISQDKWELGAPMLEAREFGACAYWKDRDILYYFGGMQYKNPGSSKTVQKLEHAKFALTFSKWEMSAGRLTNNAISSRAIIDNNHHTAFIIGTSLDWISGGGHLICNVVDLHKETVKSCQNFMKVPRTDFAVAYSASNYLWVFGGRHLVKGTSLTSLEVAKIASAKNEQKEEL
eukprot:189311_1